MASGERVLCILLDCGICDLRMLDDIEYDLCDILEDMVDNHDMNINSIFRGVFQQAAIDLSHAFERDKDEIAESIREAIAEYEKQGKEEECEDYEDDEEYQEICDDLFCLNSGEIDPEEDITWYLNYSDTHVSLKHYDFYHRWMEYHILRIENLMGFEFEDGEW